MDLEGCSELHLKSYGAGICRNGVLEFDVYFGLSASILKIFGDREATGLGWMIDDCAVEYDE